MDTPEARALLLAIGWIESGFTARVQVGGPARGFWMFEERGGTRGVLSHTKTAGFVLSAWNRVGYHSTLSLHTAQAAIEQNDVIAAVFARLLLWTLPEALPARTDPEGGWTAYMEAWRPGKPRPMAWPDAWNLGWSNLYD
jgi:hypothetical protein